VDKPVDAAPSRRQHPASAPGQPSGSVARKGLGETQPRTERGTPDRGSGRIDNERRGRIFGGSRAPARDAWTAGKTAPDARFAALPADATGLPPLPPAFATTLASGLEALRLDLPPAALGAIDVHVRLLLAWNEAINLTGITQPALIATRHVLDSLTAVPLLAAHGPDAPLRILDLGSGGGFPGLPLAAAMPAARVTLVDSTGKKARFLEAAVAATELAQRVEVRATRAESLAPSAGASARSGWGVVTARAVGSLDRLIELALPLLRVGGRLLAWKSNDIADELAAGARMAMQLGAAAPIVHPASAVSGLESHRIVEVTKLPMAGGSPRDPAARGTSRCR
jgi:16S rRNA (guanine527-N7)-methyltransferase